MPQSKAGQYVFVTGASSEIGQAIAIELSQAHDLILSGRDEKKLNMVRLKCHAPERHKVMTLDLLNASSVEAHMKSYLNDNAIGISHFIHVAGETKLSRLRSVSINVMKDLFSVNLIAAIIMVKLFTSRRVNESNLRSVVFVSSIASQFGVKGLSVYAASKGALDSFMKSVAVEFAPNVRFNSVLPGAIVTTNSQSNISTDSGYNDHQYPLGLGVPSDVAHMVDYLISDKSRWVTGQQFIIDGGRSTNVSDQ
jgi:NAD(P)-dependent dehydrogenase (short-subunit alcohol dehydrogenase family)